MSASQSHGLEIERLIREEVERFHLNWLPPQVPLESEHTARFDVPGYLDPYGQGIPTSIKSVKLRGANGALICLADATRIADLERFEQTRLLLALYRQQGDEKVFQEVREYLITGEEWRRLSGGADPEEIMAFNQAIKQPDPDQARHVARQWKAHLARLYPDTVLRWNPKIDGGTQRRLQCSVSLRNLEASIQQPERIRVFGEPQDPAGYVRPAHLQPVASGLWETGMRFPIILHSPPRHRHPRLPPPVRPKRRLG